jgi:hypothetical protein
VANDDDLVPPLGVRDEETDPTHFFKAEISLCLCDDRLDEAAAVVAR